MSRRGGKGRRTETCEEATAVTGKRSEWLESVVAMDMLKLVGSGYNLQGDVTDFLITMDITAKNIKDNSKNIA